MFQQRANRVTVHDGWAVLDAAAVQVLTQVKVGGEYQDVADKRQWRFGIAEPEALGIGLHDILEFGMSDGSAKRYFVNWIGKTTNGESFAIAFPKSVSSVPATAETVAGMLKA